MPRKRRRKRPETQQSRGEKSKGKKEGEKEGIDGVKEGEGATGNFSASY